MIRLDDMKMAKWKRDNPIQHIKFSRVKDIVNEKLEHGTGSVAMDSVWWHSPQAAAKSSWTIQLKTTK